MNWRSDPRLGWILAVLVIAYPRVSEACKIKYAGDCLVDVSCDVNDGPFWNRLDEIHETSSSINCNGNTYSNTLDIINNANSLEMKVTYDFRYQKIYNPMLPSIQYLYASKIIELNINPSEILNIPIYYEMEIVKKINISHNYLTEAKLYNEHPLNSLQVLDYSNNRISSFDEGGNENSHAFHGLTHLNISYNLLETVPAETFQYLTNLKSLDLSFNNIKSSMIAIKGPTQLQKLFLSSNMINDCAFLWSLTNLEELFLDRNQIKYLRSFEFQNLKFLKKLILNSNSIISIDNSFFKTMPLLEILDLKSNSLDEINKDAFEGVEKLITVDLSFNNIEILYKNLFKGNNISSFLIIENKIKESIVQGVFEGMSMVSELDLSNQLITGIEDNAFYMLKELISLNISHNQIQNLSKFSFKTLRKLLYLDLSDNRIVDVNFEKSELLCLKSLNLRNNLIHQLNAGVFLGLVDLQKLYLSNNNISSIAQNIFKPLQQLVTIELSQNPLEGEIEANSFSGLHSLEYLDLSHTLLNAIKRGAFFNMESLKYLNVSHSNLTELENGIFGNDTALEILDFSYNNLYKFVRISNTLINLKEFYLNHNFITEITKLDFEGLNQISKLTISQNQIEKIELHSFDTINELQNLDLSLNPMLKFKGSLVEMNWKLESLYLRGSGNQIKCTDMKSLPLLELVLSSSNISDLRSTELSQLKNLISLDLSQNTIRRIEIDVFFNLRNLRLLDLSFNQIIFIQPGSFKYNTYLNTLNISHNQITTITYGTFYGIEHVLAMDLSFNDLKTLSSKQFIEIETVKNLFVDSNKLEEIEVSNAPGLELLSLGDNLLKCEDLSKIISLSEENGQNLTITTMRIDFHTANVRGISCYHKNNTDKTNLSDVSQYIGNSSAILDILGVLSDIRNIMHAINNGRVSANVNTSNVDNKSGFSGHTTFLEVCVVFILVILVAILVYQLYVFGLPKLSRRSKRTTSTRGITESIENSNF